MREVEMGEREITGLQVLIVEDEAMIAMLLDVEVLVSETEADLAILDVNLAGQETYPLAEALASTGSAAIGLAFPFCKNPSRFGSLRRRSSKA
jgi:hypothetical protein